MGSKKVRIVITGDSKLKALEEAKKWVLHLEKEVLEQRRNCRTRGLILLGTVLLLNSRPFYNEVCGSMPNAARISLWDFVASTSRFLYLPV